MYKELYDCYSQLIKMPDIVQHVCPFCQVTVASFGELCKLARIYDVLRILIKVYSST